MNKKVYPLIATLNGISIVGIVMLSNNNRTNSTSLQNLQNINVTLQPGKIYWTYSNTCPHCKNLKETLKELNYTFIAKSPEETYIILSRYGYKWEGGVPIVYALVNGTLIIISGYPAKIQEKNGYFYLKEEEMKLCKEMNGEPYFINGTYAFCIMKKTNNYTLIMGNKYAIEWLIYKIENSK